MSKSAATTFSPMPARAMADESLTALDLRVLAALAAHDRFGANGIGCYASHPRLAELVKCHLKSLSRSLAALAERGYIEASQHPIRKRLRVYRVVYAPEDREVLTRRIGNEPVTDRDDTGNQHVPEAGPIGNRDFQESEQYQRVPNDNILREAWNISGESLNDTRLQDAPPDGDAHDVEDRNTQKNGNPATSYDAATCRECESALRTLRRDPSAADLDELRDMTSALVEIATGSDHERIRGWAHRLHEEAWEVRAELDDSWRGGAA